MSEREQERDGPALDDFPECPRCGGSHFVLVRDKHWRRLFAGDLDD